MSRAGRIIVSHLSVQIMIAVAVFRFANNEFHGPLSALPVIFLYTLITLASILVSAFFMLLKQKLRFALVFKSVLLSVFILFILPPATMACINLIPGEDSEEKFNAAVKHPTLAAVQKLGFTNYEWSPSRMLCVVKHPGNRSHGVWLDDGYLNIYAEVPNFAEADTLMWIRAALRESMPYLEAGDCFEMLTCIAKGSYRFRYVPSAGKVKLLLGPSVSDEDHRIKAEAIVYSRGSRSGTDLHIILPHRD